ncbi:MalY/PatB family protein [Cellulomonas wangsupingiae]|uniref:cysteine-S-conjugate beta-lyase n=1 Tax=Cellulomonas wangsupingiae TaxID=2968085 RepID=A0ABY5K7Z2_9CELL|nr:aminotransferase class I/II-fold pyridoxal phosphate-dependent enzyme [Cellulomonas wangsupingiae]MCC2334006.1 aminotransferase class I/II-fold pyridoxal phosphate-dependent enzyme [Cellulomonas wangsupingiae]MCM0640938.1 aminotransferase class I/II-fold pyridoxal phosphate-dependent enzyme [Cellulomonas wangsupingiae]UUI65257.1 aminotransferase class I/II-fold pyridoxal phosphate-dependent enzyme [Cellulomonas wangsupingiae]
MASPFDVTVPDLRRRTSLKWHTYPEDVLPAFVAEMDARPLDAVVTAVTGAMLAGDTGYEVGPTSPRGTAYAEAFADFAARQHGWDVPVDRTRMVPDVMLGLVEVLGLLTGPGDGVVVNPPVYPPFRSFVEHAGRHVVDAPLTAAGRLDLDALDRAFVDARAYLLCHPQNPTGTLHTADELRAVGELATRHGVRVVADEIHAPLVVGDEPFVPTTTVIPDAIALHSASKAFNLAGLKAALAVPGPAADELRRMPEIVGHGVSHVASIAHQAAYRHGDAWLADVRAAVRANGDLVAATLAERLPSARWIRPAATYFAWLDVRDTPAVVTSGTDPARLLLETGRLAVNPGPTFGAGGHGHVRLNLATSPRIVADALDRLTTTLGSPA